MGWVLTTWFASASGVSQRQREQRPGTARRVRLVLGHSCSDHENTLPLTHRSWEKDERHVDRAAPASPQTRSLSRASPADQQSRSGHPCPLPTPLGLWAVRVRLQLMKRTDGLLLENRRATNEAMKALPTFSDLAVQQGGPSCLVIIVLL